MRAHKKLIFSKLVSVPKCSWAPFVLAIAFLGLAGCGLKILGGDASEEFVAGNQEVSISDPLAFDVNDISILYPLKTIGSRDTGSLIRPSDPGFDILSESLFAQVKQTFRNKFGLDYDSSEPQAMNMQQLSQWAVTSFRYDPCFGIHPNCEQELRLVVQATTADDTDTADFAMHLVYGLGGKSERQIMEEIVTLKKDSSVKTIGLPLDVHPILKAEGLAGPFAENLRRFIQANMTTRNLKQIAFSFIEPMRLQPWFFFFSNVRNGQLSGVNQLSIFAFDEQSSALGCNVPHRHICTLQGDRIVNSPQKGSRPELDGRNPPILDDFLVIANREGNEGILERKDILHPIFNHIENPTLITQGGTNCASCHRAATDRLLYETTLPGFAAESPIDRMSGRNTERAFQPISGSACTYGIGLDMRFTMKTINVRNFGYTHRYPMIAERTMNETVYACEIIKGYR